MNKDKKIVIAEIYTKSAKDAKILERQILDLFNKKTDCIVTDRVSLKKLCRQR